MMDPKQLERDLAALRASSAREVPDLDETVNDIRRGLAMRPAPSTMRRKLMALFQTIRTRPAVAATLTGALAVLVAMVVPVSYDKVVGQDVALTVAGKGLGGAEVAQVAQGMKRALGARGGVMVEAMSGASGPTFVLHTTLPKRSGSEVREATADFARDLAAKGYAASVQVRPHRERVRYPAVAYAFDQIISISVDGKSAAALESEIRDRLAQAGVHDAQVSVTDVPGGGREVKMTVQREATNDGTAPPPEPVPQIVLTKNGAPLTGAEGMTVKVRKMKTDTSTTMIVEVNAKGKSATVEIPNADTIGDAAIQQSIAAKLQQAGIQANVTVTGGKVSVEPAP